MKSFTEQSLFTHKCNTSSLNTRLEVWKNGLHYNNASVNPVISVFFFFFFFKEKFLLLQTYRINKVK